MGIKISQNLMLVPNMQTYLSDKMPPKRVIRKNIIIIVIHMLKKSPFFQVFSFGDVSTFGISVKFVIFNTN
jgi:hypothetical protein